MHVITIASQKGGTGKTSTALALSALLASNGARVLLIDCDPQGNATQASGAEYGGRSVYDIVIPPYQPIERVIQRGALFDVIGASDNLRLLIRSNSARGAFFRAISTLTGYKFILIDTAPNLGVLTVISLLASNGVIVTSKADAYGLSGIKAIVETIQAIRSGQNPELTPYGVLMTHYKQRSKATRLIMPEIIAAAQPIGGVFQSVIRDCADITTAAIMGLDIFSYNPKSNAVIDYTNFAVELLSLLK